MDKDAKKYTAFSMSERHFKIQRMPLGLKNAPAMLHHRMDVTLKALVGKVSSIS